MPLVSYAIMKQFHHYLTTLVDQIVLKGIKSYKNLLRILATLEAKTAKISNFWTFWPVIQLIDHILTSGRTPCTFYIYGQCGKKVCTLLLKEGILAE